MFVCDSTRRRGRRAADRLCRVPARVWKTSARRRSSSATARAAHATTSPTSSASGCRRSTHSSSSSRRSRRHSSPATCARASAAARSASRRSGRRSRRGALPVATTSAVRATTWVVAGIARPPAASCYKRRRPVIAPSVCSSALHFRRLSPPSSVRLLSQTCSCGSSRDVTHPPAGGCLSRSILFYSLTLLALLLLLNANIVRWLR